jgi:hypothetical protein
VHHQPAFGSVRNQSATTHAETLTAVTPIAERPARDEIELHGATSCHRAADATSVRVDSRKAAA